MKYKCLRNCFVNSVYWREGEIYNLPESMEKYEKNFKMMGEPLPETKLTSIPVTSDDTEAEVMYYCSKCGKNHMLDSKIGKAHLEFHSEEKL